LLDVRSGDVARSLLAETDFDLDLLPPVVGDGVRAGHVRDGALRGAPVMLAGADTQCALVGLGAVAPGEAAVPAGWSAPLQLVTGAPIIDDQLRTWTGIHVVPGRWILESNAGDCGRAWDWICSMLGVSTSGAAAVAANALRGSADAMAVLGPRVMRAAEMSAGVGAITIPLPLVMSAPDRSSLLRAVAESIAYGIRANLEQLEEIVGARIEPVRLGGGMSASTLFCQILTDVLDRRVAVGASPDSSAIGAAALASVAMGEHATVDAAVESMTARHRIFEPDGTAAAEYEDYYGRWCAMSDDFRRLATET
jgi:autoinducer 2 (AI-2) kinase